MFHIASYRRQFLDKQLELTFYHYKFGVILDIGGASKRGKFKYDIHDNIIVVDNKKLIPTIIADMHYLPIKDNSVETIKITEVLEYSNNPDRIFSELNRVIQPFGNVLLSVPFNMGIHYDIDNIRFSEHMLKFLFKKHEFIPLIFTQNGLFFTVLSYMLKQAIMSFKSPLRYGLYVLFPIFDILTYFDHLSIVKNSKFFSSFTLGYFAVLMKIKIEEKCE